MNIELPEIKFGLDAVRRASLLVKTVQAEMVSPALTKDDRSPVTVADYASQALVAYLLEKAFPEDLLVAEEDASGLRAFLGEIAAGDSSLLGQITRFVRTYIPQPDPAAVCDWIDRGAAEPSGRFWTLDPIDGTKGFLRGDQYAVALALLVGGQVQLGILGCPNLVPGRDRDQPMVKEAGGRGFLVLAERGQGAWMTSLTKPGEFQRLHVSDIQDARSARLLRSFEAGHTNVDQIDEFARASGIQAGAVRMDSQAKYAVLAAGMGDLLLRLISPAKPHYREKIWDQAAGSLVVQEAGGRVTDLDGKPLDFTAGRTLAHNRGILASNSRLHQPALDALRDIQA
jgi:3'(2'), 5'-bisphosphate nucleotidase